MASSAESPQRQVPKQLPAGRSMCWPINFADLVTPVLAEVLPRASSRQVALSWVPVKPPSDHPDSWAGR